MSAVSSQASLQIPWFTCAVFLVLMIPQAQVAFKGSLTILHEANRIGLTRRSLTLAATVHAVDDMYPQVPRYRQPFGVQPKTRF